MPIYEYRCAGCGTVVEDIRDYEDRDEERFNCCPEVPVLRIPSCGQFSVAANATDAANHVLAGGSLRSHVPTNDSSDNWEGYSDSFKEKMERPNPLYYKSDKPMVDMGS